ncbi:DUF7716 domain-containing protein [Pantoea cypripedii]|uniref:DUF7716 domain-containing protein n=1 Tax=Pantoea cypripedii TaxID=55209 RepID=A0A1X1EMK3_PANCY|nr:hypothetical protein [Pantoea cypripedii]MBP2198254.1 hypothetical protein [Pantoea cypripedii]ORM90155.1 hypothetical protein HA50_26775 [Pantoea cypripedii]
MIVISGFDELLKKSNELPDVGWLYVEGSFDLESRNDIENGKYYIAENEDEEMDFEQNYGTFLEAPIFKDVIENKLNHHPGSSKDDLFDAVVYYLEKDDFLD